MFVFLIVILKFLFTLVCFFRYYFGLFSDCLLQILWSQRMRRRRRQSVTWLCTLSFSTRICSKCHQSLAWLHLDNWIELAWKLSQIGAIFLFETCLKSPFWFFNAIILPCPTSRNEFPNSLGNVRVLLNLFYWGNSLIVFWKMLSCRRCLCLEWLFQILSRAWEATNLASLIWIRAVSAAAVGLHLFF